MWPMEGVANNIRLFSSIDGEVQPMETMASCWVDWSRRHGFANNCFLELIAMRVIGISRVQDGRGDERAIQDASGEGFKLEFVLVQARAPIRRGWRAGITCNDCLRWIIGRLLLRSGAQQRDAKRPAGCA